MRSGTGTDGAAFLCGRRTLGPGHPPGTATGNSAPLTNGAIAKPLDRITMHLAKQGKIHRRMNREYTPSVEKRRSAIAGPAPQLRTGCRGALILLLKRLSGSRG